MGRCMLGYSAESVVRHTQMHPHKFRVSKMMLVSGLWDKLIIITYIGADKHHGYALTALSEG